MKSKTIEECSWNNPYIKITKNVDTEYSSILDNCLQKDTNNLSERVLNISGMSGIYYRKFINNLIREIDNPRYLEIGSWKGSTASSAIYKNKLTCTCIDNWSEFGGPKYEFERTIKEFLTSEVNFTIIEDDFRNVDYSKIGKYNIFMFDGPHSEHDQYDGITFPYESLDDVFILIVDDWNWISPRRGTQRAISDLNLEVLHSIEVFTGDNVKVPDRLFESSLWHNGYYIAICKKNKIN